jgi:hypothetical protein
MAVVLGPSLSQKDPALLPFDIDDCWVVAGLQSSRAVGASIAGVTIPVYRKAAGRPDNPNVSNPGGASDVQRGAKTLWPTLRVDISSRVWLTVRAAMVKLKRVVVLLVDSSKLAPEHQYGFRGFHAITCRAVGDQFYCINPLQPKGTSAQRYSESELRAAAEAYPQGVQAVMFAPALAPVPPIPPADPTPFSQDDLNDAREEGRVAGVQSVIDAAEALI